MLTSLDAAAFEDGILEFLGHTKWVERFGDGIGIEAGKRLEQSAAPQ